MTAEEQKLYDAANAYAFDIDTGDLNTNRDIFIAGAEWMANHFKKVEGEGTDWYERHDHEYICGFRFDEPIELPVSVYIRKEEQQ